MSGNITSGNGQFPIDAILAAVATFQNDRDEGSSPSGGLVSMDRDGLAADQPGPAGAAEQEELGQIAYQGLSPEQQDAVSEIIGLVTEFAANRSSGSGNELEAMLVTNIAAKLPPGVGTQIANAIFLEVERRGRDSFCEFGPDQWERVKKEAKDENKQKADADDYADKIQNARQQVEQERQERAEEWANSDHTYAGQKMSANEWLRMIQWFKQPENRKAWEDAVMAETGQTREQVRGTGTKMNRFYELMDKQSKGEELTPQEQAEFSRLDHDPEVRRGIETQQRVHTNRINVAPVSATNAINIDGEGSGRLSQRLATFDDEGVSAPTSRTTSFAAEIDGGIASAPTSALSANFNSQAIGAPTPPPGRVHLDQQLTGATVQIDAVNMFG